MFLLEKYFSNGLPWKLRALVMLFGCFVWLFVCVCVDGLGKKAIVGLA